MIGELLVLALFSGSTACWLLRLDDTLPLVLGAGAAGVYVEPWISLRVGPVIFEHSVVACLVGAIGVAFVIGLVQSIAEALAAWR